MSAILLKHRCVKPFRRYVNFRWHAFLVLNCSRHGPYQWYCPCYHHNIGATELTAFYSLQLWIPTHNGNKTLCVMYTGVEGPIEYHCIMVAPICSEYRVKSPAPNKYVLNTWISGLSIWSAICHLCTHGMLITVKACPKSSICTIETTLGLANTPAMTKE